MLSLFRLEKEKMSLATSGSARTTAKHAWGAKGSSKSSPTTPHSPSVTPVSVGERGGGDYPTNIASVNLVMGCPNDKAGVEIVRQKKILEQPKP